MKEHGKAKERELANENKQLREELFVAQEVVNKGELERL